MRAHTGRNRRACKGEVEKFSQGDLLAYLLDQNGQRDRLEATAAGKLLKRMAQFKYVQTLAFWVDLTAEGKIISKMFQRSNVLLSDVTSGVEDSIDAITRLETRLGNFMKGFSTDFVDTHETLYGIELSDVAGGKTEFVQTRKNVIKSICAHLNERFYSILKDPVLKAACMFEHVRWPSFSGARLSLEQYGEQEIYTLLDHFKTLFVYLGGDATKVQREWRRLKLEKTPLQVQLGVWTGGWCR